MSVEGGAPSATSRSPETAAARPREPRPEIWFNRRVSFVAAVRELWRFRELTVTLAERDLRVRYKQAVLGVAWAIIGPLVMTIAFVVLLNRVTKVSTGGAPGALFVSLSLLPWTFFSNSLSNGGLSLVTNSELLNKLYCPREVFPIAAIADAAVDAVIATFVMSLLFPITGFAPKAEIYYVPLLLLVMTMFTLGMTLAVSAIVVYARDLRLVLPLAIQVGLFATPVAYRVSTISGSKPFLIGYSALDPIAPVIEGMRATVLEGRAPEWTSLGVGAVSSLIVLLGGFMLFKRLETGMADIA